jgi:endonuclease G
MSPQRPDFNREIWAGLESFLRFYVVENEVSLFITTGPVLNDQLPKLERSINNISIPEFYYKTVIDLSNKRGVAFLLKNEASDYPIESFVISIDSLEKLTGLDFYHQLPDSLEDFLESQESIGPFQAKEKEMNVAPINWQQLPTDVINSVMAKYQINNGKTVRVVGKVVSATKSGNGHVFLNLDQSFPEQIFSISIFKSNLVNFSYSPEVELVGKTIVVRGKVGEYQGIPSMSIKDESKIEDFKL